MAACAGSLVASQSEAAATPIRLARVPDGGLQPQAALDSKGRVHLVYFRGEPGHGNLFRTISLDSCATFSNAIQVNSESGSAIATGTVRGGQIAIGRSDRIHVAWNGSGSPAPLLYARMNNAATAFEPQRNLMHRSFDLDGGGGIAADASGNIYVAWHGVGESEHSRKDEDEAKRRLWLTKSNDDGATFEPERPAWFKDTGACGCCSTKLVTAQSDGVYALYRSATQSIHRDIYLLRSADYGKTFTGRLLHSWEINACPLSSMDLAANGAVVAGAWETSGQVYWARFDREPLEIHAAPGDGQHRKHPRVALNQRGDLLLVWTEGTGWQKGGSLAYQLYDSAGIPGVRASVPGVPVWSFAAAIARADGGFSIIY
jgi:hypothetical protein